jgi:phosphoglycerate dehydrogenase-like enzyme
MTFSRFISPAIATFVLALATPVIADTTVDEMIARLGLKESATAARDMPGWTPPKAMIVMANDADRLAWYKEVIPETVTLYPARTMQDATRLAAEHPDTITAAVGFCSPGLLQAGPNIHWMQLLFAGVASCVTIPEVLQGDYVVTNTQRISGPQIAEHVMAMVLYFSRGLDHYAAAQAEKEWGRMAVPPNELWALDTKTMFIAGLGGIGTQTARLANGLGMKVTATRNSSREGPDYVDYVGLSDELPRLAAQADVVVNALPLTDATTDLFDADFFARMKPTALFINVGRGGSAVTEDLIAALENGAIAGAGLDVQDPEPMPRDHPLWDAPNLLITPHISSFNGAGQEARFMLFRENLRRYVAGDKMLSVVNIQEGY